MTRTAWIVLSILVLGLGVYAFRPAPAAPTSTAFITASATRYTLEAAGHVQDVDGEQVRLDGLARRLDANRAQGLWMTIGTLAPDPARVVAGVSQEQLSTYGLGNPARLEGSGAAFKPKAGAQVATFVSPTNTKVYKAAQLSDPSQYSPAYVMLQDAQQLADRLAGGDKDIYPWMVDEAQQIIEIARGMYDVFGKAIF